MNQSVKYIGAALVIVVFILIMASGCSDKSSKPEPTNPPHQEET